MPTPPLLHAARRALPVRRLPSPSTIRCFADQTNPDDKPLIRRINSWNPVEVPHVTRRVDSRLKDPITGTPQIVRRVSVGRARPLIRQVDTGRDVPWHEVEALEASGTPRIGRERTGEIPFRDSIDTDPTKSKIVTDMPRIKKTYVDLEGEPWVLRDGVLHRPFVTPADIQRRSFSTSARRLRDDAKNDGEERAEEDVANRPITISEPTLAPTEADLDLARSLLRLSALPTSDSTEGAATVRRVNSQEHVSNTSAPPPQAQPENTSVRRVSSTSQNNQEFRIRKYISGASKSVPELSHGDKPMSTAHDTLSQILTPLSFVRDVWSSFLKHSGLEPTLLDGLRIISAEPGSVRFCLEIKQKHTNRMKNLHGGTIAAMVDLGGSLAVASRGLFATGVSTDLNVTYVGSGGQVTNTIFAEAKIDRIGKSLAFTRLEFFDSEGQMVARGSHTKQIRMAQTHPLNRVEEMAKYAEGVELPTNTLPKEAWPVQAFQNPKLKIRKPDPPSPESSPPNPQPAPTVIHPHPQNPPQQQNPQPPPRQNSHNQPYGLAGRSYTPADVAAGLAPSSSSSSSSSPSTASSSQQGKSQPFWTWNPAIGEAMGGGSEKARTGVEVAKKQVLRGAVEIVGGELVGTREKERMILEQMEEEEGVEDEERMEEGKEHGIEQGKDRGERERKKEGEEGESEEERLSWLRLR